MKTVGVFRDSPPPEIVNIVNKLGIDVVQLHGTEGDDEIATLREELPRKVELWAACGVGAASVAPARNGADRILFDTVHRGQSGGTGEAFDWSLLSGHDDLPRAILAGGIGPANVRQASDVGAHMIDVGSGVEAAPGVKDPAKVKALFAALRPPARSDG